jgi:glycosyltransferase involved in cell wall biosynthesis
MSKIIYIGHYGDLSNKTRRFAPSAVNKINYIINTINELGFMVYLVSLSMLTTKDKIYVKGRFDKINENLKIKYFSSFREGTITGLINRKLLPIKLFFFLIFHAKKNDNVIVYHNTTFSCYKVISFVKRIINFTLILEVEEVYSNLDTSTDILKEKLILQMPDKYIFATELLNQLVNTLHKPSVTIYGSYEINNSDLSKFDDNKIHVVYAGTFDPRKGGAVAAAAAAAFLPENYFLHIMGFGSDSQIQFIESTIYEISKISDAQISYAGCLLGKEYTDFLQKCHIGLSTQNPDNIYNGTSFPSKILSYMANGLQVVSVEIDAIKQSKIGDKIFYYKKQEPKEIAKAIQNTGKNINKLKDPRDVIVSLNKEFNKKLCELLTI